MRVSKELQKICPLCGQDNQCAMAAGKAADACWCQTAVLSADALAAIPEPAQGKYCICAACGTRYQEPGNDR